MSSVDERVVDMRFNNGEFEKNIKESMKSLEDLKKALDLDKHTESLNNLDKAVSSMNFDSLAKSVDSIADKFTLLGRIGVQAMDDIARKVVGTAENIAKSLTIDQVFAGKGKYEQKTEAVQAMKAATGLDIGAIEEVMDQLVDYTDWTSFDFIQMTKTIGQFVNSGVDLYVAEQAIEGIGNAAGLAGASVQEASRAMFNFGQAMSSGAVRLVDWISIEKANMATKQFKEVIIDTAIEMGELQQIEEHVGVTTNGTIVDFQTLRDTLRYGWFTSDVLTASLMKLADRESELGAAGYEAASVTISLTQAIAAVKDMLSSGWMKTFQLIFGNFDEASELFSDITNAVTESLAPIAEWRNGILMAWRELEGREMLIAGLSNLFGGLWDIVLGVKDAFWSIFPDNMVENLSMLTIWVYNAGKALRETFGVIEIQGTAEALGDLAENAGYFVDEMSGGMADGAQSIQDSFQAIAETVYGTSKQMEDMRELSQNVTYGMANEDVRQMQEWLMAAGYQLDNFGADGVYGPETQAALKKFQEDSGLVADGIFGPKSYEAMKNVLSTVSETTKAEEDGVQPIYAMSAGLIKLQSIARGFFSIFHIGSKVLGLGFGIVQKVLSALSPLGYVIVSVAAVVGELLASLDYWIDQSGIFEYALAGVSAVLEPIGNLIAAASYSFVEFLETSEGTIAAIPMFVQALMESVKQSDFMKFFGEKIDTVKKKIEQFKMAFKALKHVIFDGEFYNAGKGNEWLEPIMTNLLIFRKKLLDAADAIKNFFITFDYNGAGKLLIEAFSTAITVVAAVVTTLHNVVVSSVPYIIAGFELIKEKALAWYEDLSAYFSDSQLVKLIVDFFDSLFPDSIPEGDEELNYFDKLVARLQAFETMITDLAKNAPVKLGAFITQVQQGFAALYKAVFEGKFTKAGEGNSFLYPIIFQILRFRKTIRDTISNVRKFGETVKDIFGQIRGAFLYGKRTDADQEWLQPILNVLVKIHEIFWPIIDDVNEFFDELHTGFGLIPKGDNLSFFEKLKSAVDILKQKFADFVDAFGGKLSLTNVLDKVKTWIREIWNGFVEAIKEYFLGESETEDSNIVRVGMLVSNNAMSDIGMGILAADEEKSLSDIAREWLLDKLKSFGDTVRNLLKNFSTTISNLIPQEWKDTFALLRDALFTGTYENNGNLSEGLVGWLDSLVAIHDFIETKVKPVIEPVISFVKNIATMFWNAVVQFVNPAHMDQNMRMPGEKVTYTLQDRLAGFVNIGKAIKSKIKEVLKSFDFSWIGKTLKFIMSHITSLVTSIGGLLLMFTGSKLMNSLSGIVNSFNSKWEPLSTKLLKFAGSIALIVGAMWVISKLSYGDLAKAGLVLVGIVGLFKLIAGLETGSGGMKKVGKSVGEFFKGIGEMIWSIAGSITIITALALVVGALVSIPGVKGIFIQGAWIIGGIAVGILGMSFALAGISKLFSSKSGRTNVDIGKMGKGVLRMSLAIGMLAGLALAIGEYISDTKRKAKFQDGLWYIAGLAAGVTGMIFIISGISKLFGTEMSKYSSIDKASKQLIIAVSAIIALSIDAAALGNMDTEKLKRGIIAVGALSGIVTVMTGVFSGLSNLKKDVGDIPGIISTVVMIGLAVGALWLLMWKLEDLAEFDPETLKALTPVLISLGAAVGVLSVIASLIGKADAGTLLQGALGIAAVGAALALVIGLVGNMGSVGIENLAVPMEDLGQAMADFSGYVEKMEFGEGSKMSGALGWLSDFLDKVASPAGDVAWQNVDQMASSLWGVGLAIALMYRSLPADVVEMYPVIRDTISNIEALISEYGTDEMITKANKVATAISKLTGAFDLYNLGASVEIGDDGEIVLPEINISKAAGSYANGIAAVFSEIAKSLPNDADITAVSELAEDANTERSNNLANFAAGVDALKLAIQSWGKMSEDLDSEKIEASIGYVKQFKDLDKDLDATNGVWGWTTTERNSQLGVFALNIVKLGDAMGNFANNVGGLGVGALMKMGLGVQMIRQFAGIQDGLKGAGGLIQLVEGSQSIAAGQLASKMGALGGGLAAYNRAISGTKNWANAEESTKPLTALANAYNALPEKGGLDGFLFGDQDLNYFADNMEELGRGIVAYDDIVGHHEFGEGTDTATKFITSLGNMLNRYTLSMGAEPLAIIGNDLQRFAVNMMNTMHILKGGTVEGVITGLGEEFIDDKIKNIIEHAKTIIGMEKEFDEDEFKGVLSTVAGDIYAFYDEMTTGVDSVKGNAMLDAVTEAINAANAIASNEHEPSVSLGRNIMGNIANGMYYKSTEILPTRVHNIVTIMKEHLQDEVEQLMSIGKEILAGIALGILSNIDILSESLKSAIRTAIDSIDMLALSMNGDGTSKFTITPVVDLSNVGDSAANIQGLLDGTTVSLGGGNIANQIVVMTDNSDVVAAISTLNNRINAMASAMTNLRIYMDTGALVGAVAPGVDLYLGQQTMIKGRR